MNKTVLWIAIVSSFLHAGLAAGYEHPGGFHTIGQIDHVKSKVAAGTEPWASAYRDLKRTVEANYVGHTPNAVRVLCVAPYGADNGGDGLIVDSRAAYLNALLYQLEDDPARRAMYAETVRTILNDWATLNVDLRSAETTGERDACGATPLIMSTAGSGLVLAAELIYDYEPWNTAERESFKDWVRELLLKKATLPARYKQTNHRDWAFFATVLANHFLDDEGRTNPELTSMSQEIDELRAWIDRRIIDGPTRLGAMSSEIGRGKHGLWYSYYGLNALTASLQIVYNTTQIDLYRYNSSRVKSAVDYLLYYCKNPGEWPHYAGSDLRNCDSGWGGSAWPRNLFEAMGEIYDDPAIVDYVGNESPITYPQAHHLGWHVPGLMRPSFEFPDGSGGGGGSSGGGEAPPPLGAPVLLP